MCSLILTLHDYLFIVQSAAHGLAGPQQLVLQVRAAVSPVRAGPQQLVLNEHKQWTRVQDLNFLARYTNGNKRLGLKLTHWNKGPAFLGNRINELESVVSGYSPHIFGVSEANFKKNHDLDDVQIDDYEVFFSKTLDNPTINSSRIAVYVHADVRRKLRSDLMDDEFSSVWLEVGLARQKKILVCQIYRDWRYLDQPDDISNSIESQLHRWILFLDQWEAALKEDKEVIVMGCSSCLYSVSACYMC